MALFTELRKICTTDPHKLMQIERDATYRQLLEVESYAEDILAARSMLLKRIARLDARLGQVPGDTSKPLEALKAFEGFSET